MNSFQRIQPDVRRDQVYRDALLAQPAEFFRDSAGAILSLPERVHRVEAMIQSLAAPYIFVNDTYCVRIRNDTPYIHLDISRHDELACTDRREFQRIKNELVSPEYDAVQLFPANSRLVDTANQYHLWAVPDTGLRLPLGAPPALDRRS